MRTWQIRNGAREVGTNRTRRNTIMVRVVLVNVIVTGTRLRYTAGHLSLALQCRHADDDDLNDIIGVRISRATTRDSIETGTLSGNGSAVFPTKTRFVFSTFLPGHDADRKITPGFVTVRTDDVYKNRP